MHERRKAMRDAASKTGCQLRRRGGRRLHDCQSVEGRGLPRFRIPAGPAEKVFGADPARLYAAHLPAGLAVAIARRSWVRRRPL